MLLIGFVAQLGVAKIWKEPYPGLFQPAFGGFGGEQGRPENMTTVPQLAVTVTYTDGGTRTFSYLDVMKQSKSDPLTVFTSAFGPGSPRRSDPRTVAWLDRRLTDLGAGRRPVHAVLAWHKVTYDVDTRQPLRTTTTDSLDVAFPGGGSRG